MRLRGVSLVILLLGGCASQLPAPESQPFAIVLGIAQDGGYPQAGCNREDCIAAWRDPSLRRRVAHLGREVIGARGVRVYAMPRMKEFLERNGPWDQLVRLGNINIETLADGVEVRLNERLAITPLRVPHRDEYSETVGFVIRGPRASVLWLPDIDKWEKWERTLESVLEQVDVAYVDGTFFDETELPGRDLREIPHPTMKETMERLKTMPAAGRGRIRFIHLNQSNPVLRDPARVTGRGFGVAVEGERVRL